MVVCSPRRGVKNLLPMLATGAMHGIGCCRNCSGKRMRVWTYVITYDDGGAPSFDPPPTTLTVCKPRIRRAAKSGELVLAFSGARLNPAEQHSVRWAGVVSDVVAMKDYWNDPRFQNKKQGRARDLPDNIYRPTKNGGFEQVPNDTHKPD